MVPLYCSQKHQNPPGSHFCFQCGEKLDLPLSQPIYPGLLLGDRYRIVRQLGQGGFGRTYLACDINRSSQNCVLKEFAPQDQLTKSQLQKAKELFEREARVLHQLQHPQIPAFREMLQLNLEGEEYLFLVQDYVEGDTYSQLLEVRQGQGLNFSEVEVRQLMCQILPVLSYIHSLNVIHRDISPDNLIQRRSDHLPVLIDFGGVKQLPATEVFWFRQMNLIRTRLGKKSYAPEEQLQQGKVFPSSDLYALAVTALVLLTGKEPQELYDSYKGIWIWEREINAPQLEAVLNKMLANKPSERYQDADEVLLALQSLSTLPPPSPNISQMRTINFVGRKPDPNLSYSQHQGGTQFIATLTPSIRWLRPWAVRVAGAGLVVLSGMSGWALVNSVIHSTHLMPVAQRRTHSEPNIPPSTSPNLLEKTRIDKIFSRRQALGIKPKSFNALVNEQFYAKHPEVRGRSLKNSPEDANLRQEWYTSAEELLDQLERARQNA